MLESGGVPSETRPRSPAELMPYLFFVIPARDTGQAAAELNGFLGSHRILAVD
jgi:hypothetical protein